jgi:hypothetical protein
MLGFPSYVNTRTGCRPICARRTRIAAPLSGTAVAFLAFAWSGSIHASRLSRSTWSQHSPVTFEARSPVASANAAMSPRCGGSSHSSCAACSRVGNRMRRVDSLNRRTDGACSSQSQSNAQRRKISRRSARVRLMGALLQPPARFACAISSMSVLSMLSSLRSARCRSSRRSLPLSSS